MIKKWMKYLLLFLIVSISLLFTIVYTEIGTRWLIKRFSIAGLSIQNVTGTLASPLELTNINYHGANQSIAIDRLSLDWSPLALLTGKLQLNKIVSNTVTITVNKIEGPSKQNTSGLTFLNTWIINHAQIKHLSLKLNHQNNTFNVDAILLHGIYDAHKVAINLNWKNLEWFNNQQLKLHNSASDIAVTGIPHHYQLQSKFKLKPTYENKVLSKQIDIVGNVDLTLDKQAIIIKNISLLSADTQIAIQGKLSPALELSWKMQSQNAAELLPGCKGKIFFNGTLTGLKHAPLLNSHFELKDIAYNDFKLRTATGIIDTIIQDHGKLGVKIVARELSADKILINKFLLKTTGTISNHLIKTNILSDQGAITWQAAGGLDLKDNKWQGKITDLHLKTSAIGNWSLKQPAAVIFSPTVAAIHDFYLQHHQQSVFIDGNWSEQQNSQFTINITSLALAQLKAFFPEKWRVNSYLNANIKLARKHLQHPSGHAEIHLSGGSIQYPVKEHLRYFNFNSGTLVAELTSAGLLMEVNLPAYNQQKIRAQINLPNFPQPFEHQAIEGKASIHLYDLGMLTSAVSYLDNPQGKITAEVNLSGTVNKLITQGSAKLIHGKADIPSLGISLKDINLSAESDSSGTIIAKGQAFSHKGMLYMNGQAKLAADNIAGAFAFTGKHFLISNQPEYKVYVSPNLVLKVANDNYFLSGDIIIPKARLMPQRYSQESIEATSDIQYVNNNNQILDNTPLNFYSNINLMLGDFVTIDYSGLSGQLTGNLRIKDSPTGTATGLGTLYLTGKYKAYGKALAINQGRLTFNGGDVANPSLDIQAVKTVSLASATADSGITNLNNAAALVAQGNKIIVGVMVEGTVQNRQVNLFSRPPILNQTDILSYLVLGRPAAQATQADAQLLYNAATALDFGGNQVSNLSEQVKNTLGLDEIDIGTMASAAPQTNTPAANNTSLILGKALTPKLYLNYSIGLIQPVNTLRLRYFFTPSWILQSETNSLANALDLFYTFDR